MFVTGCTVMSDKEIDVTKNEYTCFLRKQGNYVLTIDGVDWYDYSGFMIPAYLPHSCPKISPQIAEEVVRISGRPFARWDRNFGQMQDSQWWYILKRGSWDVAQIKNKKKRWMIRQGKKRFSVRPLTFDEILAKCPQVAQLASARYKGKSDVETPEILAKQVAAGQTVPGVLEYIGCFHKDTLVSYSENYIQNNAVWLANIRSDPAFLDEYSSYGLIDGILDYYLNERRMEYVLDGSRSIHHRTHFQDYLIKVFDFTKEYAILNVVYSAKFKMAVKLMYPFRNIAWALCGKWTNNTLDNVAAVLRQEHIRRACLDLPGMTK